MDRWTQGKGYKQYKYTTLETAYITKRSINTIRKDVCHGKLNMNDLLSVARYIVKYVDKSKG